MSCLRFKDLFNKRVVYLAEPGTLPIEAVVEGRNVKTFAVYGTNVLLHMRSIRTHALYTMQQLEPANTNLRIFSKRRQALAYAKRGVRNPSLKSNTLTMLNQLTIRDTDYDFNRTLK